MRKAQPLDPGGQAADQPFLAVEEHQGNRKAGKHGRRRRNLPKVVLLVEVLLCPHRQRQFAFVEHTEAIGYSVMDMINARINATDRMGTPKATKI